jgi:hypothetical protein
VSDEEYTWTFIQAMDRSHKWQVYRGDKGRECKACGDGPSDVVRYCPGNTNVEVETLPRVIVSPPLESPMPL